MLVPEKWCVRFVATKIEALGSVWLDPKPARVSRVHFAVPVMLRGPKKV